MNARLRVVFFFFFFAFVVVIARLFYWQIVKAEELSLLGETQYGRVVSVQPKRGEIKTSDGYAIATNKLTYLLFANPKEVKEKEKTTLLLSEATKQDVASVGGQLNLDRFWVPIQHSVDSKTKEKIESYKLPGIGFEKEALRFYPEASMAAHLLGFVGKNDAGENKGYFGLEGYYDRQLSGKIGLATQVHDAFGRPILSRMSGTSGAIDGRSFILNIDRAIQFMAQKRLLEGIEKYEAAGGMVSIINPKTGGIIAMASYPDFDPNLYSQFPSDVYKNPFISNLFEPGSTFKSLVMAGAFDANVVKPDTICTICDGPVAMGGYEIRTWNNKYYKDSTMIDVIRRSDNIGMVYVSQKLGLTKMLSYFRRFGIGDITGIDLQGEVEPPLKDEKDWYAIDVATASFGQGITVTPIELLSAFSAIANDGIRMEPHLAARIITADGKTIPILSKVLGQPISKTSAKIMAEILVNAVDNGEAKWAKPKGFRIAGKTGTAQIPIAGHYDPDKTIASFIGFAPADDPKFAMLVIVDRPTTSIYGSETAAPIFFNIAKDIFAYYDIPPSE